MYSNRMHKGMRLSDAAPLEISDHSSSGSGHTARNGATEYSVTLGALTITQNGSVIATEPRIGYWSG